jgi:hypothetical protein
MTRQLLERRLLPQLPPYDRLQAEVKYGDGGKSRVDFVLHCDGSGSGPVVIAATAAKRKRGGGGSSCSSGAAADSGDASAAATAPAAAAVSATSGTCCYLEVKSVTLAEDREVGGLCATQALPCSASLSCGAQQHRQCTCVNIRPLAMLPLLMQGGAGRIALFPDTVSDRAQRHVRELTALARAGGAAALVFLVQPDDCTAFAPCHEVRDCRRPGQQARAQLAQNANMWHLHAAGTGPGSANQSAAASCSMNWSNCLNPAVTVRRRPCAAERPNIWQACAGGGSGWGAAAASGVRPRPPYALGAVPGSPAAGLGIQMAGVEAAQCVKQALTFNTRVPAASARLPPPPAQPNWGAISQSF